MATPKYSNYTVLALKSTRSPYSDYEWVEWTSFSTKQAAEKYAKEQSKIDWGKRWNGRFLVQKRTNESIYANGKKVR